MSRLTRKDMKRDEVLDWLGRTIEYMRRHARRLLGVAAAVVAVAAIAAAVVAYRGKQAERANGLLTEALAIYNAPIDAVNPTPDNSEDPSFADEETRKLRAKAKFESLRADFEGKGMGGIAAAYLGDLAADSGDYERAEALWREAMVAVADTFLAGRLQLNLISLGKSQGRSDAVVEELRGLLNSASASLPADVVLYELARALESLERPDEAASAYQRLLDEYDDSIHAPDARRRLDEL